MAKRQIIEGDDIPSHPQPFPVAVRVGNMIFSSAVNGKDALSDTLPEAPENQIAQAFENMRRIVERGGADVGGIAKVVVYLANRDDRALVNPVWEKMFPDANDRPVRHTIAAPLPGKSIIQLEFIALAD